MNSNKIRKIKILLILAIFIFSLTTFSLIVKAESVEKIRTYGTESVQSTFYQGDTIQIKNDGTLKIFDQLLRFTITTNNTKVYVRDMNGDYNDFMSIKIGKCDLLGYTRVCFDSSSGDIINVRIFTLVPDLELQQFFQKEETSVGEENTITVDIYNDGLLDCVDCHYQEILHPSMELVKIDGADFYDGKIIWNGTIKGKDTKEIKYTYFAKDAFAYNTTANITYSNYINIIELTAKADIFATTIFDLKTAMAPKKPTIGHKTIIAWNITNIDEENENNLTVTEMYIDIPEGMRITSLPIQVLGYNLDKDQYIWSGRLEYNETRDFWIEFIPEKTGEIILPIRAKYFEGDDDLSSYSYSKDLKIDVSHKDLDLVTYYNESIPFQSSNKKNINFLLRNIDAKIDYSDIKLKVFNDFFDQTINVGVLEHNSAKNLEFELQTQPVLSEKKVELNFLVEYLTSYGDKVNSTFKREILVKPFNEIEIIHNMSEIKNITQGDIIDVDVYLKSLTPYPIENLTLEEIFPEQLFIQGQDTTYIELLKPNSITKILSYKMNIPDLNKNTSVNLTLLSSLDYSIEGVSKTISDETSFTINPGSKSLLESLMSQATITGNIVRNFSSWPIITLFLVSLVLLGASVITVYSYKREFGIPGINTIKTKERWIDKKRININRQESLLKREQAKIDSKIIILKTFLDKTQDEIKKKFPVGEERKNQLEKRKEDFMRQKKELDMKIKELQEQEDKLMQGYHALESEKQAIENDENNLTAKHEKMKKRLIELKQDFEKMINKEGNLESLKNKLTSEEIRLMKDKERLLDSGSVKIVSEKENLINEKVQLEHERNKIEEEISSLRSRKENIINEQDTIAKQKVEIKNNLNLFDSDRSTVNKSIKFLQAENNKLKEILDEMHGVVKEDVLTNKDTEDKDLKDKDTEDKDTNEIKQKQTIEDDKKIESDRKSNSNNDDNKTKKVESSEKKEDK